MKLCVKVIEIICNDSTINTLSKSKFVWKFQEYQRYQKWSFNIDILRSYIRNIEIFLQLSWEPHPFPSWAKIRVFVEEERTLMSSIDLLISTHKLFLFEFCINPVYIYRRTVSNVNELIHFYKQVLKVITTKLELGITA